MSLNDYFDGWFLACFDVKATKRLYVDVVQMQLERFVSALRKSTAVCAAPIRAESTSARTGRARLVFHRRRAIRQLIGRLARMNVPIIERTGATQKLRSVHVRDSKHNLIKISELI